MKWQVDIIISNTMTDPWATRAAHLEVEAKTSRDAAQRALVQLDLNKDEQLHTLFIHLASPYD